MTNDLFHLILLTSGCTIGVFVGLLAYNLTSKWRIKKERARRQKMLENSISDFLKAFLSASGPMVFKVNPDPKEPVFHDYQKLTPDQKKLIYEEVSKCHESGHFTKEQYEEICRAIDRGIRQEVIALHQKYHL